MKMTIEAVVYIIGTQNQLNLCKSIPSFLFLLVEIAYTVSPAHMCAHTYKLCLRAYITARRKRNGGQRIYYNDAR